MRDLIDRKALKDYVSSLSTHPLNEWDTWGVIAAIDKQPTITASQWHRVEEKPEPHKDVLVTGMEAINNSRVYKVMVNDNGTWRPTDYAPSIRWDYWMPIEPPGEEA